MTGYRIASILGGLATVVIGGTVFFRLVEGWSWLDSYFFTVVTLSTVGYGELVPATALGRIGTTVFIFLGLGIFAAAIQQFGAYALRRREGHTELLIEKLGKAEDDPANSDDRPKT